MSAQIEQILCNPFEVSEDLKAANPLGKVPALLTSDGQAYFDSTVICAYLDSLSDDVPLMPGQAPARWKALTNQSLTDGVLDAAFNIVMERRRTDSEPSAMWLDRWTAAIYRSADMLNDKISDFSGQISLAQIGLGAALGYLDFRLADMNWRDGRPDLADWYAEFSRRPSMQQTNPENT